MPHVFISYAHEDKSRLKRVVRVLEDAGMETWYDEEIRVGERLTEAIFPQLRSSRCAVFILTKYSVKSDWVRTEIQYAFDHATPIVLISFGNVSVPDDFPGDVDDTLRIAINRNLSGRKKIEFLEATRRLYDHRKAPVITMLNLKGGVGKTVLTANLFGCIHETERKSVLLIDLDPQHNLTQLLLSENDMMKAFGASKNIMSIFRGFGDLSEYPSDSQLKRMLEKCIVPLKSVKPLEPRIDLIPGTFEVITYFLGEQHQRFERNSERWVRFRQFVAYCERQYDYVAIDVNPGATLMTELALSVSSHVLSPVRPDRFATYGLSLLDLLLSKVSEDASKIRRLAIMNGVQGNERSDIEVELRSSASNGGAVEVLDATIPFSKLMIAGPAKPNASGDMTFDLAYRKSRGSGPIQKRLRAAALELSEKVGV
ncbi:AAA family ATPase [Hyphomonas sp.]|uniref:AAA family ATPase n=1 Tax=Hyphomonas sp. TaxID=87 RepID=UPI0030F83ED2